MEESQMKSVPCLKILAEHDPEYGAIFHGLFGKTFSPGALDVKTKLLIAMAVNASTGMGYGCQEIARNLTDIGTDKEEISEAIRVATTVRAIQGVVTGGQAYSIY